MGALLIDESRWPLVYLRFEGALSDPEFDDYLRRYAVVIKRGPYATVLDATQGFVPGFAQQRRQAMWMNQHRAVIDQHSRGTAFVIASPAVRFALSAIFAVSRMPGPYTVSATTQEGQAWCISQLARAGLRPGAERASV